MISRLIAQFQFTRRGLLSLALLPAFLYGTLPHTACICADGHREEHCRALAGQRCDKTSATSAPCTCCKARQTHNARNCCQANEEGLPRTGLIASGACCHPIVEAPAPVVPTAKADLASKSTLVAAVATVPEPLSADSYRPLRHSDHLSTPPPLDVVIVYLHLTI